MEPLPFSFDPVHGGLSHCSGYLRLVPEGVACEFRTDIGGLGIKSRPKEVLLRFDEVGSVTLKKGIFSIRALVIPSRLAILQRFPGTAGDSIVFRIRRRDRNRAEYFFSEVILRRDTARIDGGEIPFPDRLL